jgi:hypothetical protein
VTWACGYSLSRMSRTFTDGSVIFISQTPS